MKDVGDLYVNLCKKAKLKKSLSHNDRDIIKEIVQKIGLNESKCIKEIKNQLNIDLEKVYE